MDLQQLMLLHQLTQGGMQPGPAGLAKQGDAMEQMQNRYVPQVWGDEAQFRQPPESAVTHAGQVPEMQVPWHQDLKGLLSNIGGGPELRSLRTGGQMLNAVSKSKVGSQVQKTIDEWYKKKGYKPKSEADWMEIQKIATEGMKNAPQEIRSHLGQAWTEAKRMAKRQWDPTWTPNNRNRNLPSTTGMKVGNYNDAANTIVEGGDYAGGKLADAAEFGSNMRSPGSMPNMGGPSDASPMTALAQSAPAMPQLLQQLQGLSQQQLPRQKSSPSLEEYFLSL